MVFCDWPKPTRLSGTGGRLVDIFEVAIFLLNIFAITLKFYRQNGLPLDVMYTDSEAESAISVAAARRECKFSHTCAQILTTVEQEKIETTKVRKLEGELKLQRLQNEKERLVHREAMLKDWVMFCYFQFMGSITRPILEFEKKDLQKRCDLL